MAEILELLDWEFKTLTINMLRALMENMDNMQEQMSNGSREMEMLRKNQKKILGKNNLTEMENAFHGLICRLDATEESVSELEDMPLETSQTKTQRKKNEKKKNPECSRTVGQL